MRDKGEIRESVWTDLERAGVVRGGSVHDKIPDFLGSEERPDRFLGWKPGGGPG